MKIQILIGLCMKLKSLLTAWNSTEEYTLCLMMLFVLICENSSSHEEKQEGDGSSL